MSAALSLAELARASGAVLSGNGDVEVRGVRHDSRTVEPGDLFIAIPGAMVDGSAYAAEAVARGAVAVAAEVPVSAGVPTLAVPSAREALGRLAAIVYRHPTDALRVFGVTGTNGKTTTTWLLEEALGQLGRRPAMMGTVVYRGPGIERSAPHTTPEADDVLRFAREVLDGGATDLVMEVSSHGLALGRVDVVRFAVAAFTNLTQDHLDFHGDLARYAEAKARLFLELTPDAAVVNVDDAFGARLAERIRARGVRLLRTSASGDASAELRVTRAQFRREGLSARVETSEGPVELESLLVGRHNLENLLVALGAGIAAGHRAGDVADALRAARGAPGRLEAVPTTLDVRVLVDYAHTPDAIERVLAALRPLTPGRLFIVFGCGGDRDRAKRAPMGAAAGRGADLAVATSDNPRTERAGQILDEIEPGLRASGGRRLEVAELAAAARGYCRIEEREVAIEAAIRAARPGDTVLVAGKGHETQQIVGAVRRPFDDRAVARRVLAAREAS